MAKTGKNGVYGIDEFSIADPAANGAYPTSFPFKFKAIVSGSLTFNDQAASTNDVEVEDSEDPYAVLTSSAATKGFTAQTYDMSPEAYQALLGFTKSTDTKWNEELPTETEIYKAVQIKTKTLDDIPAKVFQWSKMKLTVTRSGSISKTGLPNLNIVFRQMAVFNDKGEKVSGHRWALLDDVKDALEAAKKSGI